MEIRYSHANEQMYVILHNLLKFSSFMYHETKEGYIFSKILVYNDKTESMRKEFFTH